MKEKQENSKICDFFGTPYVQHLGRDLKNQISTILKTNCQKPNLTKTSIQQSLSLDYIFTVISTRLT